MPGQATTGLTPEQFDELVARVDKRIIWDSGIGGPRALTLRQAVKVTIMYFKNNITEELIGELLFVDQSTVSRAIKDLEGVIAEALKEFVPDLTEEMNGRVVVVDGSLCPCWSREDTPELHSGKHKTTGHSHQFVCDLSGNLLHISEPLPGKTHDAKSHEGVRPDRQTPRREFHRRQGVISAPGPPLPFASPPGVNYWTGRRNSTRRSTNSAT